LSLTSKGARTKRKSLLLGLLSNGAWGVGVEG
jgi:hypothetical protein